MQQFMSKMAYFIITFTITKLYIHRMQLLFDDKFNKAISWIEYLWLYVDMIEDNSITLCISLLVYTKDRSDYIMQHIACVKRQ